MPWRSFFACLRFNSSVYPIDSIPNFTPADIETVRQLVHQRYRETIEIQAATSELMLNPSITQRSFGRYRRIMNETLVNIDSNSSLSVGQISIDTDVGNSLQSRGSVI